MKFQGGKETVLSFIFGIGSKIIAYLLLLVLANFFIQSDYGRAAFVLAIFQLVLYFSVIGMPEVFVPWIIKKKDTSSVFYALLLVNLALIVIGILITLKYLWIMPIVFTLPFILFLGLGGAILRAQYKYHIAVFLNLLFITIVLISLFLLKDLGKSGIIFAHTIGYFIVGSIAFLLTRKRIFEIMSKARINLKNFIDYVKKSLIAYTLILSFAFLGWIDTTILGLLSSFENVAKYNIASPIANVITLIPFSLSLFLLTKSAEVKNVKKSLPPMKTALRFSYTFTLIAAILINSLIFLIRKIFFPIYVGIEIFVMILSIGIVFYSIYFLLSTYLTGRLTPEKAIVPIVVAALTNIILDIVLVPKFGLYGITIATTIAHGLALVFFIIKMKLKELIYAILLTGLVPLSFYLGYYGILLIVIVIPILFYLKLIHKQDIVIVKETIKGMFK